MDLSCIEDVGGEAPHVVTAEHADWAAVLAELGPDEVVTNDEYCLADCAELRNAFGLAARLPAYPLNYLDKVTMKRELAAAGIAVPRFWAFEPVVTRAAVASPHEVYRRDTIHSVVLWSSDPAQVAYDAQALAGGDS
ncbi:MAG: hypothetical protein HOU81_24200 [Hamadaea sp.]|uniref:hypothetical protein n=1 Tax=Hamadaea sp. TaxID=2024425 RepID=UPI00183FA8E4|nr:hypothetical protein [Hamadaea sp.]NUR73928.1 hypothetical protein [Hamadaea sp.]NUT19597.1 hypothetical protein [Hamadaea sp.]